MTASTRSEDRAPAVPGESRPQAAMPASPDPDILVLITTIAAVVRLHALAAKSFWFDEGVSVAIARLDWYNFARILWRREGNMALYYLLLRPWLHFGTSEAYLRGLSGLFGVATIPVVYWLGRRMFDSRVGLIAAGLLAVNAYHVRYSQEARSYALMGLLCVLSSLYFLESLREPSCGNRIGHILASTLAVYAHFFSGLLILAQWVALRFLDRGTARGRMERNWRWIGLAVLPVAVFVATTGAGPLRWIQRPGGKGLWELAMHMTGNGGPWLLLAFVVACLAAVVPVRGQWGRRIPWEAWRYAYLLFWLLFPPLLTVAVSFARPLFLPRYFFFCLPALALLAAAGLARLRPAWLLTPVLLLVLALSLRGTVSYYRQDFDLQRDDWRGLSQYVLSHAESGDALVFHIAMGRMPFEYYRSRQGALPDAPHVLYPRHADQITFLDFVEKPDFARLQSSLPHYDRVWLVLSYAETPAGLDPTASELEKLLAADFPKAEKKNLAGLEVVLYSKGDQSSGAE